MRLAHVLALTAAFTVIAPAGAVAQFTPIPNSAQTPPGAGAGNQPACMRDFVAIRQNAEKAAAALKAANERKPPLSEACKLFNQFVSAELKMLKFMETNNVWCGIPPQAIQQVKTNHAQVLQVRKRVCDAAKAQASGGGPAPLPSLSDALGTTRVPSATTTTTKSGGGAFDTLTGNPLAR